MYLWDSNILRHFGGSHSALKRRVEKVSWSEIALPSVVIAETLRGRCEFALKATPEQIVFAYDLLSETQRFLARFNVISFDEKSAAILRDLRERFKKRKRYADLMIAAQALAGNHIVVTRNVKDFRTILPPNLLENWIDDPL